MATPARKIELEVTTPGEVEIHTEREFDAPRYFVWRAHLEAELLSRWWGRGNPLSIDRLEPHSGGHWQFTEQHEGGSATFSGRFREITPETRIVQTFGWEGMRGHEIVNDTTFEDLPEGRTKIHTTSQFRTREERDGILDAGMPQGQSLSYQALDKVLESMKQ